MVEYDPKVIYRFADHLYRRANLIIAAYSVIATIAGGVGFALLVASEFERPDQRGVWVLVGMLIGAAIGIKLGRDRASALKLQAQMALCNVKIEENTRKS